MTTVYQPPGIRFKNCSARFTGRPRPTPRWCRRPAAESAMAVRAACCPVKDIGEPVAGEPHGRFDGEGLETGVGYGTWK